MSGPCLLGPPTGGRASPLHTGPNQGEALGLGEGGWLPRSSRAGAGPPTVRSPPSSWDFATPAAPPQMPADTSGGAPAWEAAWHAAAATSATEPPLASTASPVALPAASYAAPSSPPPARTATAAAAPASRGAAPPRDIVAPAAAPCAIAEPPCTLVTPPATCAASSTLPPDASTYAPAPSPAISAASSTVAPAAIAAVAAAAAASCKVPPDASMACGQGQGVRVTSSTCQCSVGQGSRASLAANPAAWAPSASTEPPSHEGAPWRISPTCQTPVVAPIAAARGCAEPPCWRAASPAAVIASSLVPPPVNVAAPASSPAACAASSLLAPVASRAWLAASRPAPAWVASSWLPPAAPRAACALAPHVAAATTSCGEPRVLLKLASLLVASERASSAARAGSREGVQHEASSGCASPTAGGWRRSGAFPRRDRGGVSCSSVGRRETPLLSSSPASSSLLSQEGQHVIPLGSAAGRC
jgi:hypothetical protein